MIGPLVKVVEKMSNEFINFLIFYLILTLLLVIVGTLMFGFYVPHYNSLFTSLVNITNASMGNFSF